MPVLLLLASLLLLRSATASNTSCAQETCGNLTIKYPFSLAGAQPLYCGYPVFDLACDAAHSPAQAYLSNTFRDRLFRVRDISYENNSMVTSLNTSFAGDTGCPVPDFNVSASLALFPLNISTANNRLVFFYDCHVPSDLRLPRQCANCHIVLLMKCDLCGNRDGPCGQEDSSKHSFYIQLRKNFKDRLNVPCFARKKFNSDTDDMLFVETEGRDLYAFELEKTKHKTRISEGQYDEFLVDYNMEQGDRIKLDMDNEPPYIFMYPMDKYGQIKERVLEEFVFKNTHTTMVHSKNFRPTGSKMARMNKAAMKHGLGVGAVFVHTMTNSDINKNMMHIPKAITSVLDIPWNGKAKLVMERFGIVERAKCYKSKDGRLRFKKGWPEFADKANLQIREVYLLMFDIVEDKLVIYVDHVRY